jgi:hypothetical protein
VRQKPRRKGLKKAQRILDARDEAWLRQKEKIFTQRVAALAFARCANLQVA